MLVSSFEKLPLDVLLIISSYSEIDNKIVKLSTTMNKLFSDNVNDIKKNYDVFRVYKSSIFIKKITSMKPHLNFLREF